MGPYEKERRVNFLKRIVEPENVDRIAQWIRWNALAKKYPDQYKVKYFGIDFGILRKYDWFSNWVLLQMCDEFKPKPELKVVK